MAAAATSARYPSRRRAKEAPAAASVDESGGVMLTPRLALIFGATPYARAADDSREEQHRPRPGGLVSELTDMDHAAKVIFIGIARIGSGFCLGIPISAA
jgi:hypothetical protein